MLEKAKEAAARAAVAKYVRDGAVVGLGTGTTAEHAIKEVARLVKGGYEIIGIPTSKATEKLALQLGIELSDLNEHPEPDLTIDGADEVDRDFNLLKGGKGAHTMEKIVALSSRLFVVVVDETKLKARLRGKVPVEVLRPALRLAEKKLLALGASQVFRRLELSDNGNPILDAEFKEIDPPELESRINSIPGVIENGIFAARRPEALFVGRRDGTAFEVRR